MNGPRHEILPGAALTQQQHRGARDGRHAPHERPHLLDFWVLAQDRLNRILPAPRLLERGPRFKQRALRQGAREERGQLVDVDRFGEVLGRASLERLDGRGDVGVPRQHENGQVAVDRAQPACHLNAVQLGHHEVGDHGVGRLLGMARQQRVRVAEHLGSEPPRTEVPSHELGVH